MNRTVLIPLLVYGVRGQGWCFARGGRARVKQTADIGRPDVVAIPRMVFSEVGITMSSALGKKTTGNSGSAKLPVSSFARSGYALKRFIG